MDRGLSSKYTDKVHPVDDHFSHMEKLGAKPGLINPRLNKMTSDVIKVRYVKVHLPKSVSGAVTISLFCLFSAIVLLAILQKSLDQVLLLYIFIRDV